VEDLTPDWGVILKQRLAMYRELREEAQAAVHLLAMMRFMKDMSVLSIW